MGLVDFETLLLDPIHTVLGEDAVLVPDGSETAYPFSAIDQTAGIEVGDPTGVMMPTIKPAAEIRVSELEAHGLTREALKSATLQLNGKTWRVESNAPKPTPQGEAVGWLLLILIEDEGGS